MIKRDYYLERIIHNMRNGEVKVITGIRRCGKSVLLFELFYDYLISSGVPDENIIKISLDQRRFFKYRNPITLCEYVESIYCNRNSSFLILHSSLKKRRLAAAKTTAYCLIRSILVRMLLYVVAPAVIDFSLAHECRDCST